MSQGPSRCVTPSLSAFELLVRILISVPTLLIITGIAEGSLTMFEMAFEEKIVDLIQLSLMLLYYYFLSM